MIHVGCWKCLFLIPWNFYIVIGAKSREHELIEALQSLLEKLNSGKIPISPEMLKQSSGQSFGATGMSVVSGQGAAVDKLLARQNQERIQLDKELRLEEEKEIESLLSEDVRKKYKLNILKRV